MTLMDDPKPYKKNSIALSIAFIILLFSLPLFSYAIQTYTYNRPSYGVQYNYNHYNYNHGYDLNYRTYFQLPNAYRYSGAANYVAGYGDYGGNPRLMSSTSCNLLGCRQNYDSHIFVKNQLDYVYYKNPDLLEPRYMDNHQGYARNLWPQRLY
jgi:hypothetical protein